MHFGAINGLTPNRNQNDSAEAFGQMLVDKPGNRLGQLAKTIGIDPAHAGLTPAADALSKAYGQNKPPVDGIPEKPTQQPLNGQLTLGGVFANEVIRRLEESEGEAALNPDGQPKDNNDLRHSLGQTMDWIRERFGDDTAAAAAGMILQSTSSGVTEETLADGLLDTLQFIDRNFGFTAGDAAIAKFNSSLNTELNEYFENGQSELFYAVETPTDGPSAVQDLTTRLFVKTDEQEVDKDAVSLTEQLLNKLKDDLDEVAELQDLTAQLEADFTPGAQTTQNAIAAYTNQSAPAEPQFTSMAV